MTRRGFCTLCLIRPGIVVCITFLNTCSWIMIDCEKSFICTNKINSLKKLHWRSLTLPHDVKITLWNVIVKYAEVFYILFVYLYHKNYDSTMHNNICVLTVFVESTGISFQPLISTPSSGMSTEIAACSETNRIGKLAILDSKSYCCASIKGHCYHKT